jgi:hypothetical protein
MSRALSHQGFALAKQPRVLRVVNTGTLVGTLASTQEDLVAFAYIPCLRAGNRGRTPAVALRLGHPCRRMRQDPENGVLAKPQRATLA